ncbi:exodeoxyribonuclease VII large subunit [Hydrogenispora ethanolica]|uniref:Exodeoxyribonuclease 7 large subunit n=1 Tax=Hydrogenispora ethanolica TaxID=1082276 RepID=A0A4R1RFS0_HYDET|nr:exodeoxyribonuclease VII large subunit [Hydrogenispora ethanolica]TCL64749.1 exodeoxyribonuclease VII large subunit [Hydrogenispora ethanolica]
MAEPIISVSQLTQTIKQVIEESFLLSRVWIRGEISNFTRHSSGHLYFTLKDEGARLSCVMFKSQARLLRFKPADGMAIQVRGRLSVYEKLGQYQLYVEEMAETGQGDLHAAFERLKARLAAEGLFDADRKKPLPSLPQKIGLITSPTGAAVRDMIKILRRRRPNLDILIIPAQVQGDEAPASLVKALAEAGRFHNLDLVIIGRGGGSLEDLWAFNDERVARAIADFPLPIISAVGHETDFTIADFVSDLRAPTPSAAAELAVPEQASLQNNLIALRGRLLAGMNRKIQTCRRDWQRIMQSRVFQAPRAPLDRRRQEVDLLSEQMIRITRQHLLLERERSLRILGKLDSLSPLATLGRGYAIVRKADGTFVTRSEQVEAEEAVHVTLASGALHCKVTSTENFKLP